MAKGSNAVVDALSHGHPCHSCGAVCGRYAAVALAAPRDTDDRHLIRWYPAHRKVCVSIDRDGDWWVQVGTDCRHLAAGGSCRNYEDPPQLCRNYGTESCEQARPRMASTRRPRSTWT